MCCLVLCFFIQIISTNQVRLRPLRNADWDPYFTSTNCSCLSLFLHLHILNFFVFCCLVALGWLRSRPRCQREPSSSWTFQRDSPASCLMLGESVFLWSHCINLNEFLVCVSVRFLWFLTCHSFQSTLLCETDWKNIALLQRKFSKAELYVHFKFSNGW